MLILSILLLLSSNAVAIRRDKSILYARTVIAILISCFLLAASSYYSKFIDTGIGLFGGLYHLTSITHVFSMFIFIITCIIIQLNGFYPRKIDVKNNFTLFGILNNKYNVYFNKFFLNKMSEQFRILEYPLIILFALLGGIFLISSCDLISVFLAIELQSYGLYILCTIYRNSERAASGGLTYFLLGGLSSCFILLGSSLIYSNSGNTTFDGLYIINNITNSSEFVNNIVPSSIIWYESYYIYFSLVIFSVGFLFKISAAPFHFWSPDVYDAIPTIVTTFVAVFTKISIFILLLEVVHYTTNFLSFSTKQLYDVQRDLFFGYSWTFSLLISSLLSLIIGAVLGLTQFRIKRLYAYSTITHIGFILLALAVNTIESIQSFLFYLMQYSLSNLNAFILLIAIGSSLYFYVEKKSEEIKDKYSLINISDKNNSPIQVTSQLKGYFQINPALSLSLAITLFSFVGIPPLVGFFAKQMVLNSALDSGYIFIVIVAILTSVVSAYYYLALVKQIFFFKTDYIFNTVIKNPNLWLINNTGKKTYTVLGIDNIVLSNSLSVTISILTLIILLFILIPQEWLTMANILALILFNC